VRIFKTDAEEKVVSVERIPDDGSEDSDGEADEGAPDQTPPTA
jgi:DNA gyrase subunit A